MSTNYTIKSFYEPDDIKQGFHVYVDILDDAVTGPIYLQLDGVAFTATNGRITVAIPRESAALLGLPFERTP